MISDAPVIVLVIAVFAVLMAVGIVLRAARGHGRGTDHRLSSGRTSTVDDTAPDLPASPAARHHNQGHHSHHGHSHDAGWLNGGHGGAHGGGHGGFGHGHGGFGHGGGHGGFDGGGGHHG
ncbi:hypothetical protein [Actinacidiphila acidipaludis]|uniref:Uncharacterized protein n=1 Tax=Actinacidiphila acidipaludis TaxID=2873382 RepID=A0ABS7PYU1_9ACTN|nr:hypothetical protein [Streptomyces acidipaludis]MBY8876028.1 hypothetical protein [Streptomyces acidipaludis]